MKILLVSTAYWPHPCGGSEHVYYLSQGLKVRGHKVTILTTNYPSNQECFTSDVETIRYGRAVIININKGSSPYSVGYDVPFKVRKLLQEREYDIVHLHSCYPFEIGFWTLLFSRSVNVFTPHTVGFRRHVFYNLGSLIFRPLIKKLHGRIYVSNQARFWNEPYLPGDGRVIPNGVDINRFSPKALPFERPKDSFIILYVGRLDHKKGILLLLEAFNRIKDEFPQVLLYIVGKGPLKAKALEYAQANNFEDRVRFFGFVPREELPRFYRTADLYVAPTLGAEALGIVLLEALASGKPTLASRIGGYDEVIRDGKDGLFFTPGSADDLAEKITQIITNPSLQEQLSINACQRAEEFSWERIVEKIENYYFYLLGKYKKN
jgi:phosphatidylinositol alpha-mannosyltransferase